MQKLKSWAGEAYTLPVTVTHIPVTLATYTTSRRMVGTSLVQFSALFRLGSSNHDIAGNYDISTLHYDGPGDVPGAPGGGYGYDIRVEGVKSASPA